MGVSEAPVDWFWEKLNGKERERLRKRLLAVICAWAGNRLA